MAADNLLYGQVLAVDPLEEVDGGVEGPAIRNLRGKEAGQKEVALENHALGGQPYSEHAVSVSIGDRQHDDVSGRVAERERPGDCDDVGFGAALRQGVRDHGV